MAKSFLLFTITVPPLGAGTNPGGGTSSAGRSVQADTGELGLKPPSVRSSAPEQPDATTIGSDNIAHTAVALRMVLTNGLFRHA